MPVERIDVLLADNFAYSAVDLAAGEYFPCNRRLDRIRWVSSDGTPLRIVTNEHQLRGIRIRWLEIRYPVDGRLIELAKTRCY